MAPKSAEDRAAIAADKAKAKADKKAELAAAKEQKKADAQAEKDAITKAKADAKAAGKPLSKKGLAKVKKDAKAKRAPAAASSKLAQAGPQKPSVGRIVHFVLTETNSRGEHEVRPAIIVRIPVVAIPEPAVEATGVVEDKPNTGSRADAAARRAATPVERKPTGAVNLVVFCDGQNDKSISDLGGSAWLSDVYYDEAGAPGTWRWPERV